MLRELRHALADAVAAGMSELEARVQAFPPKAMDVPPSGIFAFVQPASTYVTPWMSMSITGYAQVDFEVVIRTTDGEPGAAWDLLDDLIDPQSDAPNVFGAILADRTLGLAGVDAAPLLDAVSAGVRDGIAGDGGPVVTFYEVTLPVRVTVQRS